MSFDLRRRLLAEAVGTGILVLFGAGSVVARTLGEGQLDYPGLGMVAIAIAVVIYAFGTTSGGARQPRVLSRERLESHYLAVDEVPNGQERAAASSSAANRFEAERRRGASAVMRSAPGHQVGALELHAQGHRGR
jgi:hypothetical protein